MQISYSTVELWQTGNANHTLIRDNVAQLANGAVRYDHDGDQQDDGDDPDVDDPRETVAYSYDARGRMQNVEHMLDPQGTPATVEDTTYTYDETTGRVTQLDTLEGALNYEYDELGKLIRTYTGDPDPSRTSTTDDGKAVTDTRYTFDALGRMTDVD